MNKPTNKSPENSMNKWRKTLLIPLATLIIVLLVIDFSTLFGSSNLSFVTHKNISLLLSIIFIIMGLLAIILKDKLTTNYKTAFLACLLISMNFLNLALKLPFLRNLVFILAIAMVIYFRKGKK
jgi:hypothetical protein